MCGRAGICNLEILGIAPLIGAPVEYRGAGASASDRAARPATPPLRPMLEEEEDTLTQKNECLATYVYYGMLLGSPPHTQKLIPHVIPIQLLLPPSDDQI